MILDREITVYVCGNSIFSREYWVHRFQQFFDAATTIQAIGNWEGTQEPVVLVSHLFNTKTPDYKYYELDQLVREYKRSANQETVLIVERKVYTRMI